MRTRLVLLVGIVGVGGAFGLVSAKTMPVMAPIQAAGQQLPVLGEVPDFSLIDQDGSPVTRATLNGAVWIVDFIFTRCAGQCPLISAQMAALQQTLGRQQGIRFFSVSVDPRHDTPQVLAAYARHYEAPSRQWTFVTGDEEAVTRLVQQGFHLALGGGGAASEPITHSVKLVLLDRHSRIRGYYDATDPAAMARLQQEARQLANAQAAP